MLIKRSLNITYCKLKVACSFHFATHPAILQSRLYKMQIFDTFLYNYLVSSKKKQYLCTVKLKN